MRFSLLLALALLLVQDEKPALPDDLAGDVLIILDNSASMGARHGDSTAFEIARASAIRFVERLKGKPGVSVVTSDGTLLTGGGDRHRTLDALKDARLSDLPGGPGLGKLPMRWRPPNAVVFTDLRQAGDGLKDFKAAWIVDVGADEPANVAVTGIDIDGLLVMDSTVRFTVTLAGKATGLPVDLWIDGARRAARRVDVAGTGRAEFTWTFRDAGPHWVKASIPADDIPSDNDWYLALHVGAINALVVSKEETTLGAGIPVNVTVVSPELYHLEGRPDLVVLDNLPGYSEERATSLTEFVERGGGVLIALGPDSMHSGIAPARIDGERVTGVVHFDRKERIEVHSYWKLKDFKEAEVLARFSDAAATPAIIVRRLGEGRVVMLNGTLAGFAAIMPQVVGIVAERSRARINLTAGQPLQLRIPIEQYEREFDFRLMEPGKLEVRLSTIAPKVDERDASLAWDPRDRGIYRVDGATTVTFVAFNMDRRESLPAKLDPKKVFPDATAVRIQKDRVALKAEPRAPEPVGLRVALKPPQNLGLPETTATDLNVRVPIGTTVSFEGDVDGDIEKAEMLLGKMAKPLEIAGKRTFKGSFTLDAERLSCALVFGGSKQPLQFELAGIVDAPPVVKIVEPPAERTVSCVALQPFVVEISDDYGVAGVKVLLRLNGEEAWRETELDLKRFAKDGSRMLAVFTLNVAHARVVETGAPARLDPAAMAVQEGDIIEVKVAARDAKPNSQAASVTLVVGSHGAVEMEFAHQLERFVGAITNLHRRQEMILQRVDRLAERLKGKQDLAAEEMGDVRFQAQDQEWLCAKVRKARAEVEQLRLGALQNRLWDQASAEDKALVAIRDGLVEIADASIELKKASRASISADGKRFDAARPHVARMAEHLAGATKKLEAHRESEKAAMPVRVKAEREREAGRKICKGCRGGGCKEHR